MTVSRHTAGVAAGVTPIIHGQDDRRAECAIVTRSVSEANSLAALAYASGYDGAVKNPG